MVNTMESEVYEVYEVYELKAIFELGDGFELIFLGI